MVEIVIIIIAGLTILVPSLIGLVYYYKDFKKHQKG